MWYRTSQQNSCSYIPFAQQWRRI